VHIFTGRLTSVPARYAPIPIRLGSEQRIESNRRVEKTGMEFVFDPICVSFNQLIKRYGKNESKIKSILSFRVSSIPVPRISIPIDSESRTANRFD
jgi:hypothetical protein